MEWEMESGEVIGIFRVPPESSGAEEYRIDLRDIGLVDFPTVANRRTYGVLETIGRFVIGKAKTVTALSQGRTREMTQANFDGRIEVVERVGATALEEFGPLFDAKVRVKAVQNVAHATRRLPSEIAGSVSLFDVCYYAADLIRKFP